MLPRLFVTFALKTSTSATPTRVWVRVLSVSTLWAATAVSVAQATTLSAVACASGTPNVMSLYLVDIIDVI